MGATMGSPEDPEHVERTSLQRWVIGAGSVVAAVAAAVAFTAGGTPSRAMQSPFDPPATPASSAPATSWTCATVSSVPQYAMAYEIYLNLCHVRTRPLAWLAPWLPRMSCLRVCLAHRLPRAAG